MTQPAHFIRVNGIRVNEGDKLEVLKQISPATTLKWAHQHAQVAKGEFTSGLQQGSVPVADNREIKVDARVAERLHQVLQERGYQALYEGTSPSVQRRFLQKLHALTKGPKQ